MRMLSTKVKWLIGIFGILILSNLPPLQTIFKIFFDQNIYYYSPGDGRWIYDENIFTGRIFTFRKYTLPEERLQYPEADTLIYRNFKKNAIAFWRYSDYLFDERYTLPYMPLEEARRKRKEWKEKMIREGRPY